MAVNLSGGSMRIEAGVHTAMTLLKVESSNFQKRNE